MAVCSSPLNPNAKFSAPSNIAVVEDNNSIDIHQGLAVRFWLGDEIVNPDTTGIGITVQRHQVTMLMAYLQH
jgi:hypothetical protein